MLPVDPEGTIPGMDQVFRIKTTNRSGLAVLIIENLTAGTGKGVGVPDPRCGPWFIKVPGR
ncbi:hypothetical protein D3C86_2056970 [compost metagenome]